MITKQRAVISQNNKKGGLEVYKAQRSQFVAFIASLLEKVETTCNSHRNGNRGMMEPPEAYDNVLFNDP
ncbi:uncharacterized protein BdWA1_003726 [Babesia duncani]|nr:hypothetical protein BdWA1_003726 [Babesia duncani]